MAETGPWLLAEMASVPVRRLVSMAASEPSVSAPAMLTLVQEKTRIGTSTPDSVSACIDVAFTRLVKSLPIPAANGVADKPTTAALHS